MSILATLTIALIGGGIGGIVGYAARGVEVDILASKAASALDFGRAQKARAERLVDQLNATADRRNFDARRAEASKVLVQGLDTLLRNYAADMTAITEEERSRGA